MVPDKQGVASSSRQLQTVVNALGDVKLVTVCRSNRDGYTPRHLQHDIEQQVLSILTQAYPNHNMIYDEALMTHLQTGQ